MQDEDKREIIISRIKRSRTPADRYAAELELLHYDMEQCRVWSTALSREFSLRLVEILQAYAETQVTKNPWNRD